MFLALSVLTIGCLVTSSSAYMVMSYGNCPDMPGQEALDWQLYKGRWYVLQTFDVPYLTHLSCMSVDYYLLDNYTVFITTTGVRHYDWFGISFWHTPVMIREEGVIANLSRPAELTTSLGQYSLHSHTTAYVIVDTDYDSYSLVYACYEPTMFNIKIETAWILTREIGKVPDNMELLKNNLTNYNITADNFLWANNTNCCTWPVRRDLNFTVEAERQRNYTKPTRKSHVHY